MVQQTAMQMPSNVVPTIIGESRPPPVKKLKPKPPPLPEPQQVISEMAMGNGGQAIVGQSGRYIKCYNHKPRNRL